MNPPPPDAAMADKAVTSLPRAVPLQVMRPVQENIPPTRRDREQLLRAVKMYCTRSELVPPVPVEHLREHAQSLLQDMGLDQKFAEYTGILINNELWREYLATIPYERRLLLMPKCLRVEERCPAPFDEFGLLCKECGLCSIQDLQKEAESLGYAVLVAEGSQIVMSIIETGKIDAIVGVSCISVLERAFPYMEAAAIPGVAIPLLQDDCRDTNVDMDWVWEIIHLNSDDESRRLDLDGIREEVDGWFSDASLSRIMGPVDGPADALARGWLQRDGKRWRPFLSVAMYRALLAGSAGAIDELSLQKAAVAVECFHKASLIHDDIEDDDDQRYGQDTLHTEVGVPQALNAGDLLIGEGYRLLAEVEIDAGRKNQLMRFAALGHRALSLGQGQELAWRDDPKPVSDIDMMNLFQQKTAPAFAVALQVGAVCASADEHLLAAIASYADALGIAYQINDDLQDAEAGAEGSDIRRDRPSLVMTMAHRKAQPSERDLINSWWQGDTAVTEAQLQQLLEDLDVRQRVRQLLESWKQQAVDSLSQVQDMSVKGLLRRVVGKIFNDIEIKGWCSEFASADAAQDDSGQTAAG